MNESLGNISATTLRRKNKNTGEKTWPNATFSTTNPI